LLGYFQFSPNFFLSAHLKSQKNEDASLASTVRQAELQASIAHWGVAAMEI